MTARTAKKPKGPEEAAPISKESEGTEQAPSESNASCGVSKVFTRPDVAKRGDEDRGDTSDTIGLQRFDGLRLVTSGQLEAAHFPPSLLLLGEWLTDEQIAMMFALTGVGKSLAAISIA